MHERFSPYLKLATLTLDVGISQMLSGTLKLKHFFVVTRVPLPVGIRLPVGSFSHAASVERIPTHQSFYHADGRNNQKEHQAKDYSRGNKRKTFGQHHPGFIRQYQRSGPKQAQKDQ